MFMLNCIDFDAFLVSLNHIYNDFANMKYFVGSLCTHIQSADKYIFRNISV